MVLLHPPQCLGRRRQRVRIADAQEADASQHRARSVHLQLEQRAVVREAQVPDVGRAGDGEVRHFAAFLQLVQVRRAFLVGGGQQPSVARERDRGGRRSFQLQLALRLERARVEKLDAPRTACCDRGAVGRERQRGGFRHFGKQTPGRTLAERGLARLLSGGDVPDQERVLLLAHRDLLRVGRELHPDRRSGERSRSDALPVGRDVEVRDALAVSGEHAARAALQVEEVDVAISRRHRDESAGAGDLVLLRGRQRERVFAFQAHAVLVGREDPAAAIGDANGVERQHARLAAAQIEEACALGTGHDQAASRVHERAFAGTGAIELAQQRAVADCVQAHRAGDIARGDGRSVGGEGDALDRIGRGEAPQLAAGREIEDARGSVQAPRRDGLPVGREGGGDHPAFGAGDARDAGRVLAFDHRAPARLRAVLVDAGGGVEDVRLVPEEVALGAVRLLEERLRQVVPRLGERGLRTLRFVVDGDERADEQEQRKAADPRERAVLLHEAAEQLPRTVLVGADVAAGEVGLDFAGDFFGAAVAGRAIALQGVLGDGAQLGRRVAKNGPDARRRIADHFRDHRIRGLAVEGRPAGQDLEEDGAEAPYVAALVDLVELALGLLGAHVRRRAERVAGDGRVGRAHQLGFASHLFRAHVLLPVRFGESPVEDDGLAELADHDVLGLEVAMHHAAAVRVGDGVADVGEMREELEARGESAGLGELLLERDAADQLLRVVGDAVGMRAQLVDRDDVWMLELAGDAGLADEARGGGLRLAARRRAGPAVGVGQQLLQRDLAAQVLVEGEQHARLAAAAVLAAHVVAAGRLGGDGAFVGSGRAAAHQGRRRVGMRAHDGRVAAFAEQRRVSAFADQRG